MDVPKCSKTHLWELDQDFQAKGIKDEDDWTKEILLRNLGIPKTADLPKSQLFGDDSSDSDGVEFSEHKFDVRLDPKCGYPCEKDIGWFDMAMSSKPWDDSRRPYEQVLKPEELTLTEEEQNGKLTGMVVSTGIGFLDAIPLNDGFALTKLQLSSRGLTDVQLLDRYKYLQYLDISKNAIQDLSSIERLVYLIHLDASHNEIAQYDPKPTPWFITNLNFSYNKFVTMPDVTSMWSLKYLNLSNNYITKIGSIKNLRYLEYLNLSHNEIEIIENIYDVQLRTLDLSWNRITHCMDTEDEHTGLKNVLTLHRLNVSHNNITTLNNLSCINEYNLRHLNIGHNKFQCVSGFDDLARYKSLRYLWIEGNNLVEELPDLTRMCIYLLPQLEYINGKKLTKVERLSAYSTWSMDPVINEMKNYCFDLLYSNIQPPSYGKEMARHLDYDIPVVVLVGPLGSKKNTITKLLAEKYANFVRVPALHTTMYPYSADADHVLCEEFRALKLYHIDQDKFNSMRNRGEFLFVHSDSGDQFALSRNELLDDERLCLIPLPIGPALCLTWQGLKTTLVLLKFANKESHEEALQEYVASLFYAHNQRDEFLEEDRESIQEDNLDESQDRRSTRLIQSSGIRSRSKSAGDSNAILGASLSEGVTEPSRAGSHSSVDTLELKSEEGGGFECAESTFSRDMLVRSTVWWSDEDSDEVVVEEEVEPGKEEQVPFIESLKLSKSAKQQIWRSYEKYCGEWEAYDKVSQTYFAHTVTVEDVMAAVKKIAPILLEKYNSNTAVEEYGRETENPLFEKLVEPRLKEMMEILHDKRIIDDHFSNKNVQPVFEYGESLTKMDVKSKSESESLSDIDSTPSVSIIDSDCSGKHIAEPSVFPMEHKVITPPSTPSSRLEAIAKESMERAGFSLYRDGKMFKYNNV